MTQFIPGLKLSEYLFQEAIQPIMERQFPKLTYSAARLDWGSDVIGFDTPMSMDHGWGPKMTLFLKVEDHAEFHETLHNYFAHHLPFDIHGFPTHFGEPLADGGVMTPTKTYPIHHMITITTQEKFFADYLAVDIHQPLSPSIWLTLPQQRLRTVRAGQIYHDGLRTLSEIQQRFHWYPHDLWLYLMANQWRRIDQDEPFLGRTGSVGDELGSRLIAARLIREVMRLTFLMAEQYTPYTKWLGTAFQQLELATKLSPVFQKTLNCQDWEELESCFSKIFRWMADAHNSLGVTGFINPEVSHFHNRPFLVSHADRFVQALLEKIQDPDVRSLPPYLGSVDQIVDNTDVLENNSHCQRIRSLYSDPK